MLFFSSCAVSTKVSQVTFKVTKIDELQNGKREVFMTDQRTKRKFKTVCTCDTVIVGLVFTVETIQPVKSKLYK